MIQLLELILNILTTIAIGVVTWLLWPLLTALVAALNALVHFFIH